MPLPTGPADADRERALAEVARVRLVAIRVGAGPVIVGMVRCEVHVAACLLVGPAPGNRRLRLRLPSNRTCRESAPKYSTRRRFLAPFYDWNRRE